MANFTTRRNFGKPADGDSNWGSTYNDNFDKTEEELSFSSTKFKNTLHEQNSFSGIGRWEQMAMDSATGHTALDTAYRYATFDGQYVYFHGIFADTIVRYNTEGRFRDITSWENIAIESALGGALDGTNHLDGATFDGRYVYFTVADENTMVRFDTTGVFTAFESGAWETISSSSAQGATAPAGANFNGCTFDGRYVYHVPFISIDMVRYDTTGPFDSISSWHQMDVRSAHGSNTTVNAEFIGTVFDGRYVYFAPDQGSTIARFDTESGGLAAFQGIANWEQLNADSAQGGAGAADQYGGMTFDGRYVYLSPISNDTFVRFDTTGVFTDFESSAWETLAMSSGLGATELDVAFIGVTFDGRYVYYPAINSDTHVRFDSTKPFTDITAWQQVSIASAQGAAVLDLAYNQAIFDGQYVYYVPRDSDTFIRFRAHNTPGSTPPEYAQVSN